MNVGCAREPVSGASRSSADANFKDWTSPFGGDKGVHMHEFGKIIRVVCGHQWTSVDEWVDCLHRLAELSDDDINCLSAMADRDNPRRCRRRPLLPGKASAADSTTLRDGGLVFRTY
jgi:hypothetical protein